jgi:malonyl CoA-acyl carrier protein transacylase
MNFASRISHVKFSEPGTLLYSLVDQRGLDSPELIRNEVIRNLYHPLNWFITMQVMLMKQHSTGMFIECGPSGGLAKNAKFVSGNYHFYTLNTIPATSFLP